MRRVLCSCVIAIAIAAVGLATGCTGSTKRAEPQTVVVAPPPAPKAESQSKTGTESMGGWEKPIVDTEGKAVHAPVSALPRFVDLATTQDELLTQAIVVAREEVGNGMANGYGLEARQQQIFSVWLPQMQALQAELAKIQADRQAAADAATKEAARMAGIERKLDAVEAKYAEETAAENRKLIGIEPQ